MYYQLWETLERLSSQEAILGLQVPVALEQLQAGLEVPRTLLGDVIWRKAYPTDPNPQSLVTVQVRQLLSLSLRAQQKKLLKDKERQEAAAKEVAAGIDSVITEYKAKRKRAALEAGA